MIAPLKKQTSQKVSFFLRIDTNDTDVKITHHSHCVRRRSRRLPTSSYLTRLHFYALNDDHIDTMGSRQQRNAGYHGEHKHGNVRVTTAVSAGGGLNDMQYAMYLCPVERRAKLEGRCGFLTPKTEL